MFRRESSGSDHGDSDGMAIVLGYLVNRELLCQQIFAVNELTQSNQYTHIHMYVCVCVCVLKYIYYSYGILYSGVSNEVKSWQKPKPLFQYDALDD